MKFKRQMNVQEQNAALLQSIRELTDRLNDLQGNLSWLREIVLNRLGIMEPGALVELAEIPEQEGRLFVGAWLSPREQFFSFDVLIPYDVSEVPLVETWDDVTKTIDTRPRVRGKGKAVGCLALEVLRETTAA